MSRRLATLALENGVSATDLDDRPWRFMAASEHRRHALSFAKRVAKANCSVLIMGPTGVGKDVLAEDIHRHSARRHKPFIAVNCGALSVHLFESELFGHCRGAYTSAVSEKPGLVEIADGGTLFLDEIGELTPEAQAKLLRFFANGTYWPVGATSERRADVRLICATNRDLPSMLDKAFRSDLYFRMSAVALSVPFLEGPDTDLLARTFLSELCACHAVDFSTTNIEQLAALAAQCAWHGGARELRNALERFLLLYDPSQTIEQTWELAVQAPHRPTRSNSQTIPPTPTVDMAVADPSTIVERFDDLVFLSLAEGTHDVRELAHRLKRSLPTVYERLKRLGIKPKDLGPTRIVTGAKERTRHDLAQHQSWIQSILKDFQES